MRKYLTPLLLVTGLLAPLLAMAQGIDPDPVAASITPVGMDPVLGYILNIGPSGALAYGAYLLGKGVKVTVQVELAEKDHDLLERGVVAVEAATS